MLIKRPEIRIVSKDITLETGEVVRAFFALVNIEGQVEVRFLGTRPLEATQAAPEAVVLLSSPSCELCAEAPVKIGAVSVFSPYFSLDLFANQLARAPSVC